jgi:RimJ/RimL family protein N-acetyltransferase
MSNEEPILVKDIVNLREYLVLKKKNITDQDLMRYTSHTRIPKNMDNYIDEAIDFILNGLYLKKYFMFILSNPFYKGEINLQNINWINKTAEMTFFIWSKGSTVEAGKQVIDHAFSKLNLNKIWLGTPACHIAMQKVAEKIGMKKEAELKKEFYLDGKYYDVYRYSIFQEDYYKC